MSLLRRLISSFSFRLLFITMLVFFAALIVMRMALYRATVNQAVEEVKRSVNEQYFHIDNGITKRGYQHGLNLIASIIHFDIENAYALAYVDKAGRMREGNLTAWPEVTPAEGEWFTFQVAALPEGTLENSNESLTEGFESIRSMESMQTRTFLARIHRYPNGAKLLVGYDMRHVLQTRKLLFNVVVENTIMSIVAAVLCSLIISYLIGRRLRVINRTCTTVISGNLEERATTSGGRDEFDQLAINFNAMLTWITRLIHSITDTTNALAHDMRTPLSRHRIYLTKLIERPDFPENHKPDIQSAIDEVDNIVTLYDSILNISRAESRAAIESFTDFSVHDLLSNVVELYEILAEQRSVSITLNCPTQLSLKGEQQLIAQAVANLVDNAVKYAPENTTVHIRAYEKNQEIIIEVRDAGIGIPAEEREKVKERFYRLDKSRTTSGTGLGLSLVDAVMRLHNGTFVLGDAAPGLKACLRFPNNR